MSRDPLLPTRLVDGVWVTYLETAGQAVRAEATFASPPSPPARETLPLSHGVVIPVTVNADDWRKFVEFHNDPVTVKRDPATGEISASFDAEATRPDEEPIPVRVTVTWTPPRTIYAAIALDGSGVWAIGDTPEEARALALDRRAVHRKDARQLVFSDFPPPATDEAWADRLLFAAMTGATEALRAVILSDLKDVIPWCPADLWDTPEPTKESQND